MLLPHLLRARASFKNALANCTDIDPSILPYREDVLAYLASRQQAGTTLILATASHERWAHAVAVHLGSFDRVLATTATCNLKGARKLQAIQADAAGAPFGYVGDAHADVPIWAKARDVVMVAPSKRLRAKLSAPSPTILGTLPKRAQAVVRALRPHQWAKNALLVVPLLLARQITDLSRVSLALAAFAAFSLCASSVYVLNDWLDVEADRAHPRKRKRPFASGALPLAAAPMLASLLLAVSVSLAAWALPLRFLAVLGIYFATTTAYSLVLKNRVLVDVFVLATLYTLRIVAGGVATDLLVSEWLLGFSIFLFTSLAFAKRYVEMTRLIAEGKDKAEGRAYLTSDISLLEVLGGSSGYLSVLVFALYIKNGLPAFYSRPELLWLACPLLMYWISRLWLMAKRGELHDDPVVFALTDRTSLGIGAAVGILVALAAPF